MADWPSIAGIDDRQLAVSLRVSGPAALMRVYDSHAPRLYDYCHSLLCADGNEHADQGEHAHHRDHDAAAEALHDAMIAAVQHAARLHDPERFRGWLYALAHHECRRRRGERTTATATATDAAPDAGDASGAPACADAGTGTGTGREAAAPTGSTTASTVASTTASTVASTTATSATFAPGEAPSGAETADAPAHPDPRAHTVAATPSELVAAALPALTGRQADMIRLAVRHELGAPDVAAILGLPEATGADEVGKTVQRFVGALAAPVAISAAGKDCPPGTVLLNTGPPTPGHFKRLAKHVRSCATCGRYRDVLVPMTQMLQAAPAAAVPPEVRTRLHLTANSAEHGETRQRIARAAEPFDRTGWPVPARSGRGGWAERMGRAGRLGRDSDRVPLLWSVVGVTAGTALIVGTAVAYLPDWSGRGADHDRLRAGSPVAPLPSDLPGPGGEFRPETGSTTGAITPGPEKPGEEATREPRSTTPSPVPAPTVTVKSCTIVAGKNTCEITLSVSGQPWRWQVNGTSRGLAASGGGTLQPDESTKILVTRTAPCGQDGAGSVNVSDVGSIPVAWDCP